jgi:nucleoside-triphosphate--adenylate kinase
MLVGLGDCKGSLVSFFSSQNKFLSHFSYVALFSLSPLLKRATKCTDVGDSTFGLYPLLPRFPLYSFTLLAFSSSSWPPKMGRGWMKGSNILRQFHVSRTYSTSRNVDSNTIRALIIGSPGSGKGTLSSRLLKIVPSLAYISGGDVLRQEIHKKSEIGKQADQVIRSGDLMPDEIMMKMISSKVIDLGLQTSWLLDGFPRTKGQAIMFDDALKERSQALNMVLHLDVPNDVVMGRIMDRWIHESSGRTYNMKFNPPKVEGKDDVTGEALVKRSDDDAVSRDTGTSTVLFLFLFGLSMLTAQSFHSTPQETFKARLISFQEQTQPMIDYFANQQTVDDVPVYVRLSGTSSDEIWPRMLSVVKKRFGNAVQDE